MSASPLLRVRFLPRLAAAEAAAGAQDHVALDALVRELSPLALELQDPVLLERYDAVFALTDREAGLYERMSLEPGEGSYTPPHVDAEFGGPSTDTRESEGR